MVILEDVVDGLLWNFCPLPLMSVGMLSAQVVFNAITECIFNFLHSQNNNHKALQA